MSLWLHKSSHHPQCSEELCFLWFGVSEECRYYGVIWPFSSSNTVNVVTMQRKAGTTILSKRIKISFYFFSWCDETVLLLIEVDKWSSSHFTTAAPWQRSMIMKYIFWLAPHLHKHTQAHHLFLLLCCYHAKQDNKISTFASCVVFYMFFLSSPKGTLCDNNNYISLIHDALCRMPVI